MAEDNNQQNNIPADDIEQDMQGRVFERNLEAEILAELKELNDNLSRGDFSSLGTRGPKMSQSNARVASGNRSTPFGQFKNVSRGRRGRSMQAGDFLDGFEEALMDGLGVTDFKKRIGQAVNGFADALGVNLEEVPKTLGKEFGKRALSTLEKSKAFEKLKSQLDERVGNMASSLKDKFMSGVSNYDSQNKSNFGDVFSKIFQSAGNSQGDSMLSKLFGSGSSASSAAGQAAGQAGAQAAASSAAGSAGAGAAGAGAAAGAGSAAAGIAGAAGSAGAGAAGAGAAAGAGSAAAGTAAAGTAAGAAASGLSAVAAAAGPYAIIILAVIVALKLLKKAITPAIEGFKDLKKALKDSANRDTTSRKKNLEEAQKRLEADVKTLVETPFKILNDAVDSVTHAWDENIRKINATQGYNKADLQDLMASFADQLREDNLSSVIGAQDITSNLSKVLESGLSGPVAESFAYLATKLNAAIPTQDFFGYAEQYASIVGNGIKAGQSQAEAIAYANAQLEIFASNVLYASRQLTHGVTTGLKDAQSLFDDAVKIAQTAKTNNAAQISGVLTAVSAVTGSIAPDLANEIVSAVVKAATGGNASDLVALRSLAGINASNTDFLRQFARDPKGIFTAVFRGLAQKQQMAPEAYMEVAEGLADVFGVSMEALSRVDFNYLAQAISQMNVSDAALNENLDLLASGETTTNAEMMRLAQANEYMVNEGLALVLDNEAGRLIQQHMWDEQIARELQESTYAVQLQGAALSFLEGIKQTIDNILNFLNPFRWITKKITNMVNTANESAALQADIYRTLIAGSVGDAGQHKSELHALTTRNQALNLVDSYVEMLGGRSAYKRARNTTQHVIQSLNTSANLGDILDNHLSWAIGSIETALYGKSSSRSGYRWGTIGKSTARSLMSQTSGGGLVSQIVGATAQAAADTSNNAIREIMSNMLSEDYIASIANAGGGYQEWRASAASQHISDIDAAMEEMGYTATQIEGMFQNYTTQQGATQQANRQEDEAAFWASTKKYADTNLLYPEKLYESVVSDNGVISHIDLLVSPIDLLKEVTISGFSVTYQTLSKIYSSVSDIVDSWQSYMVSKLLQPNDFTANTIAELRRAEAAESNDAIYRLADVLVNQGDLTDPQTQTNALLSQILIVLQAMSKDPGNVASLTLGDTLQSLVTMSGSKRN